MSIDDCEIGSGECMDYIHRKKRIAVRDSAAGLAPQPSSSFAQTFSTVSAFNSTTTAVVSFPSASSSAASANEVFDLQMCTQLRDAGRYVSFSGRRKALPNILDIQRAAAAAAASSSPTDLWSSSR